MECPHCLKQLHDDAERTQVGSQSYLDWLVYSQKCPACKQLILELVSEWNITFPSRAHQRSLALKGLEPTRCFIYPKTHGRKPCPSEVPPKIVEDYNEACLVLSDSPKASAALSRRCLQHVLKHIKGVPEGTLAKAIDHVLENSLLPSFLMEDIDHIRQTGNIAAHPIESKSTGEIVPVEPGEAEANLNLLEGLFQHLFVEPARAKERRNQLDAKLKDAGKPKMKGAPEDTVED